MEIFKPFGIVVALLIGVLCHGPTQAQAPTVQQVPGTTVSMTPPAGFALAGEFAGFKDGNGAASILVVELPAEAYPQLSAPFGDLEMARTSFATKGISVTALKRIDTPPGAALFLSGTQTVGSLHLNKWMALLKGEKTQQRFIRMIAFVPADRVDETRAVVEAIARSIASRP